MPHYDPHLLSQAAIIALRNVIKEINSKVERSPRKFLEKQFNDRRCKMALVIDLIAEHRFSDELEKELTKHQSSEIEVFGEETIERRDDFNGRDGIFALADMVDGTDLLERSFSNWCSAVTFFRPRNDPGQRIIGAWVGLPNGDVYYSHEEMEGVSVYQNPDSHQFLKPEQLHRDVAGRSDVQSLDCASVCFYGQKAECLEEVVMSSLIPAMTALDQAKPKTAEGKSKVCRLYNLAGIPMMIRLIDYRAKEAKACNVDVVFDIHGQQPHDVVPGAYLALKNGATMRDLGGVAITNIELERALLEPASKQFKYVLASTPELCETVRILVTSKRREKISKSPKRRSV